MKKTLNIFLFVAAIIVAQACGPKEEKKQDAAQITEASGEKKEVVMTVADRRAKLEREKAERAEQRRINFETLSAASPSYTDSKGNVIYNKAEINPSFKGGDNAMMQYLHDNVKFPVEAKAKGLEGTVFVDFVVAKDGTVREVDATDLTTEDVDNSFRKEAVRVVASMPKWLPGRQQGVAVDVKFSIPITFEMN